MLASNGVSILIVGCCVTGVGSDVRNAEYATGRFFIDNNEHQTAMLPHVFMQEGDHGLFDIVRVWGYPRVHCWAPISLS